MQIKKENKIMIMMIVMLSSTFIEMIMTIDVMTLWQKMMARINNKNDNDDDDDIR